MSLKKMFVKINALNKLREGHIMFNYKFDDETINCASETIKLSKEDKFAELYKIFNSINDDYYLFITLKSFLKPIEERKINNDFSDLEKVNLEEVFKICIPEIFSENECNELIKIKNYVLNEINFLKFKTRSLDLIKDNALSNLNFSLNIKVKNKSENIKKEFLNISEELKAIENNIVTKENDYALKYNDLLKNLNGFSEKSYSSLPKILKEYDENLLNNYAINCIFKTALPILKTLTKFEITSLFENENIKNVLGDNLQKFKFLVGFYDVGTDS